ncbi:hypothetical protein [uncultured Fibrella sp.]|uniref:hypothetical protein n=1 Tax=uncultured Fibrella sp. TaxID=1284596 RepID=UPI0035C977E6
MNSENQLSRRQVIGGIGGGLATVMATPVLAASESTYTPAAPTAAPCKTRLRSIPNHRLRSSRNPGQDWPAKWTPSLIMAKPATKGQAG